MSSSAPVSSSGKPVQPQEMKDAKQQELEAEQNWKDALEQVAEARQRMALAKEVHDAAQQKKTEAEKQEAFVRDLTTTTKELMNEAEQPDKKEVRVAAYLKQAACYHAALSRLQAAGVAYDTAHNDYKSAEVAWQQAEQDCARMRRLYSQLKGSALQLDAKLQQEWEKKVLVAMKEDGKKLHPLAAKLGKASPLHDMVADFTHFTQLLFPTAAEQARHIASNHLSDSHGRLPEQLDSAATAKLPDCGDAMQAEMQAFLLELERIRNATPSKKIKNTRQMTITKEMLDAWLLTEKGHFENAELTTSEPEQYLENVIVGALPRLIDLVGLRLKSGEVYSKSFIPGFPKPAKAAKGKRTNGVFMDMLGVDCDGREVLAHETSERKDATQKIQYPHAIEDRQKLARQAIAVTHQMQAKKVPSKVYLTQLHRETHLASSLVFSYMCYEVIKGLPVLYDVFRVPLRDFLGGGPPTEVEQYQMLGACLRITLDFAAVYAHEGVERPKDFHPNPVTPARVVDSQSGRPAAEVVDSQSGRPAENLMSAFTSLSLVEEQNGNGSNKADKDDNKQKKDKDENKQKKDDDADADADADADNGNGSSEDPPPPPNTGAGAGGGVDPTGGTDSASHRPSTRSSGRSRGAGGPKGSAGRVHAMCLRDDWGGKEVKTLLGPSVQHLVPGFDLANPDYISDFSQVFVGHARGPNADFVLKLHNNDCGELFERELSALRRLSGVRGVPVVEAVVLVPGTGGGMITRRIEDYPWPDVAEDATAFEALAGGLVSVLSAAHARGVAHCDIKDTAVMRRRRGGDLVLNDWNLSHTGDAALNGQVVGTPQFALSLWRPPSPFALDCVALAVLLGWACEVAGVGQLEESGTFEDTLDRVCCWRRHWETEPPAERWHAKVLLLVHLLLVCCDEPLQVTYQQWYYGCWLAADDARSALALGRLAAARTQVCHQTLVVSFLDYIRDLQLQRRELYAQHKEDEPEEHPPTRQQQSGRKEEQKLVLTSLPQQATRVAVPAGGSRGPPPSSRVLKCAPTQTASPSHPQADATFVQDAENRDPQIML